VGGPARRMRLQRAETEGVMNWDEVSGKCNQIQGEAKARWGQLANDNLTVIAGKRDVLVGKIQER